MAAILIFKIRRMVQTIEGETLSIYMDLYKLSKPYDSSFPEGFKFSWIAYEENAPDNRVLFDCHPPKGPHLHINSDVEGTPFEWESLEQARSFFFLKVIEHFGEVPNLRGI